MVDLQALRTPATAAPRTLLHPHRVPRVSPKRDQLQSDDQSGSLRRSATLFVFSGIPSGV